MRRRGEFFGYLKIFFLFTFLFLILFSVSVSSLKDKTAIVYGNNLGHDTSARNYFLNASPGDWTADLASDVLDPGYSLIEFTNYAIDNNYSIIIHSYSDVYAKKSEWERAMDNETLVVSALGSTSFIDLSSSVPRLTYAITVSGGNESIDNSSYGDGLELFDIAYDGRIEQSYTNAMVAAKAAWIMSNYTHYNVWDVRQHLRQISSFYGAGGNWTREGGYGKPDIGLNISSLGLGAPIEIQYSVDSSGNINFSWARFEQTNESGVRIYKDDNDTVIYNGTAENFFYDFETPGNFTFFIRSYYNVTEEESSDESYSTLSINLSSPFSIGIGNCTELQSVNDNLLANYYLEGDIDCSDTVNWNNGAGFIPLGNSTTGFSFAGIFDGMNYTISDLFINRTGESYVALFGYLKGFDSSQDPIIVGSNRTAIIRNVGLENVNITGYDYSSALVGSADSDSVIENSYVTGDVVGINSNAAGFISYFEGDYINNSYSLVDIIGDDYVAGFISSHLGGYIYNAYSAGIVAGNSNLGGFSSNGVGQTVNVFWDNQTSTQTTSQDGTGKNLSDIKNIFSFTNVSSDGLTYAWDFTENVYDDSFGNGIWNISTVNNSGYPYLSWQFDFASVESSGSSGGSSGGGGGGGGSSSKTVNNSNGSIQKPSGTSSFDEINLKIVSPENITYYENGVLLKVVDESNIAKYFEYSLNGQESIEFSGEIFLENLNEKNVLLVYAGTSSSDLKLYQNVTFYFEKQIISCNFSDCNVSENVFLCSLRCFDFSLKNYFVLVLALIFIFLIIGFFLARKYWPK